MGKNITIIVLVISLAVVGYFFWREARTDLVPAPHNGQNGGTGAATSTSYKDLIRVTSPLPGEAIESPLRITGEARGNWYFEASFPVVLTDWDGRIIAEGFATAQGEWMTTEYVPFEAALTFTKPEFGERGFLILQKDNPSGLPEHDDAFEFEIKFE